MNRLSGAVRKVAAWWRSWRFNSARYRAAVRAAYRQARLAEEGESRARRYQDELAELREELLERQRIISNLEGELEVLRGQIEMFSAWEARERERLEAETAMHAARKVRALDNQSPETEL